MTDSERALAMAEEITRLRGLGPITLKIDAFDGFVLVACLQLAWRHPTLSDDNRRIIEDFGRALQRAYNSYEVPEVARTLEQGWQREYDR